MVRLLSVVILGGGVSITGLVLADIGIANWLRAAAGPNAFTTGGEYTVAVMIMLILFGALAALYSMLYALYRSCRRFSGSK